MGASSGTTSACKLVPVAAAAAHISTRQTDWLRGDSFDGETDSQSDGKKSAGRKGQLQWVNGAVLESTEEKAIWWEATKDLLFHFT